MRIDLNCDLGEGAGHDAELMPLVTSANIACGAHAGDPATMRATVELALRHGVAIGAHPGFADREHFGRRELPVTAFEVRRLIVEQTSALQTIARELEAKITHVKPHGALYNMAARDLAVANAIAKAVEELDHKLVIFTLPDCALACAARARRLKVACEVFADRTYQGDGRLTGRNQPDALIASEDAAVAQVLRMIREGKVRATSGAEVAITADTVCLHGDGAHAVAFARRLRAELAAAGVEAKAFSA